MASRITVTPKGYTVQKEIQTETKSQFPPLLNLNLLTQTERRTSVAKSPFRSARFATDESENLADNPFNSTITYTRCGYFGPKKKSAPNEENLSKARPMYYPNYLQKSHEDYPNAHFKILTPDKPLRHLPPTHPKASLRIDTNSDAASLLGEAASTQRLPIKYVHHTIFPYTRKDTPSFLKTSTDLSTHRVSSTHNISQLNTPKQNIKIDVVVSDYTEKSIGLEKKFANSKSHRQEEFQKTMFMEKTIVSDYYSGKLLKKYDDQKLDRMKDRHLASQKNFYKTLRVLEDKYQRKLDSLHENMNTAPDFIKLMKKNEEEIIDATNKMKSHEYARFRQRIDKIQREKYTGTWSRFHFGVRPKTEGVAKPRPSQKDQQTSSEEQGLSFKNETSRENI